ncbi:transcriptional regulator [Myxococcus sp. 1LA]
MESSLRTPGQLIQQLLDERGWTQQVLAAVLACNKATISLIVAGKRDVDAQLALTLEKIFGVPAERFMELQKAYELSRARITALPDPGLARRAALFGALPVAEMAKRGWIQVEDLKKLDKVEVALTRFFRADAADGIPVLQHAAKKTDASSAATPTQTAWLYRVKQIAEEMMVPRYSPTGLRSALPELRALMNDPENTRHVPRLLMECGVRFAIVETIGDAKIDGACIWLNEDTAPVIALSMRFDRIDNFWFVLRHEIEHVLQGHGRGAMMLDVDIEGDGGGADPGTAAEENVANAAAAEFCVPQEKLRKFVTVKAPFYPERDMLGFARTLRVHPGIVAGQIRRATRRYELFTKHLVKVRSVVTSAATVDGWGDVVPVTTM